jgi:hypothetical protein
MRSPLSFVCRSRGVQMTPAVCSRSVGRAGGCAARTETPRRAGDEQIGHVIEATVQPDYRRARERYSV